MTRDELRGISPGISDEQLKKILDINSQDIGKAKADFDVMKSELSEANKKIEGMTEKMESLKNGQYEAEKMNEKVKELQEAIDSRKIEDEALAKEKALEDRFRIVVGDKSFLNDYTEKGIYALFSQSLDTEENKGKSDTEIFEKLTKGNLNIFNQESEMPRVIDSSTGFGGDLTQGDIREIMGLPPENGKV